ncbi:hypothetical protein CSPAE12_04085 [Colletotrichum incanum]|nr:hypothetical protein CSPAE12_04085 [Colletotrichum incanum]
MLCLLGRNIRSPLRRSCPQDLIKIKDRERLALLEFIEARSVVADMPCTRCFRAKTACRFGEGSSRCRSCIEAKKPCDGVLVASTLQKLNAQQKEWDEKEEAAGEELLRLHEELARLQSLMATAAGRLSRIRKTRKLVRERQAETFRRGMQEVDESDALESALDAHERGMVEELQFMQVPNDVDWSLYGLGDEFSDLGPLVQASGSKVSASRGSPGAAVGSAEGS